MHKSTMADANYRHLDEDASSPAASPVASPAPSRGRNGKRNDGTDSNFMDYKNNNGGELYTSQKILLSLIAIACVCALLRWLRGRASSRSE